MTPAPSTGANTGTRMKTAITCDMAEAIACPSNRSRTTAIATTREPAAPTPHTNRLTRSQPNVGASALPSAPST